MNCRAQRFRIPASAAIAFRASQFWLSEVARVHAHGVCVCAHIASASMCVHLEISNSLMAVSLRAVHFLA